MKRTPLFLIGLLIWGSSAVFAQAAQKTVELPRLTIEQKWETAESNLVYFIISGISFAKSKGHSAADYGAWTGRLGCPYWKSLGPMDISRFVQELSANKQQFKDFQMEILESSESQIRGRMKGFGLNWLKMMEWGGVSEQEYEQFFSSKWAAIAACVGFEYRQETKGEWTYFTVRRKA